MKIKVTRRIEGQGWVAASSAEVDAEPPISFEPSESGGEIELRWIVAICRRLFDACKTETPN